MATQVIVLGGGLAGMSAAHSVVQAGGRVLVLDKSPFCGGNSTKATSGINAAGTSSQRALNIPDAPEIFEADTLKSAAADARPALIRTLTHQSGPSIEWLINSFDLDLSVVSRLAAHTHPRTHRGKDGNSSFPGMMITYRLIERLEDLAAKNDGRVTILTKARAIRLLTDAAKGGAVVGVEYEFEGSVHSAYGPVVIATGGFAADFAPDSLLSQVEAKWRESEPWKGIPLPPLLSLPTTNGPHCSGDGIKMALAVGAGTADLHAVQVHPTGLVEPSDPDAKVKWLAAEALRGCGGIILDAEGKRFCDELGKRDYVTGRMWAHGKAPYRLILNTAARKQINWHCEHYTARGLMKKLTGAELAREIGCSVDTLNATFGDYNRFAANPGTDPWGKKYFNAVPFETPDEFHVAVITPVIHYCMGGVAGNERAEVLTPANAVIPGLYVAGEVMGGVHGTNRLGGSSLLDCVVYGRIAGTQSARYLLDESLSVLKEGRVATGGAGGPGALTDGSGTTITLTLNPEANKVSMDVTWAGVKGGAAGGAGGPSPRPAGGSAIPKGSGGDPVPAGVKSAASDAPSGPKGFTKAEVSTHNNAESCWVIIANKVYDVTKFLDDHPGGKKTILIYAGKDATKEFGMMHQPEILTKYGPKFYIGDVIEDGSGAPKAADAAAASGGEGKYETDKKDLKGSTVQSWNSGGTAGELPAERAKASFNVEKLTNLVDGGEEKTARRRYILAPLGRMEHIDKYNMTRNELMEAHFRDFIAIHKPFILEGYVPKREEVVWMGENSTLSGSLMPHMGLFLPTIAGQADADQQGWWLWKTMTFEIVGSYAQTELGHGSNVRGLKTIAEYDPATQEFVLNTPTLQSMKWWISGLGLAATHATVYAQLVIKGKEYGVHVFMVQLRDEDHRLLPGIEAGDVGPKLGDNAIDTGYLRLKNVRIPRQHLLSKRQHVEPDGTYVKHTKGGSNDKAHYLTMMQARAGMIGIAAGKLAIAATIAIRYSCVRRQGFIDIAQDISHNSTERKIIEYQVQQYRLFKQLAIAYAIKFSSQWINRRFDDENLHTDELGTEIAEVHATSAGLKGLATYLVAIGIEDCRKSCGGHGYLLNSGVAALSADYVWQTTAEGDFLVMLLQTARFLMKQFEGARRGEAMSGLMSYLNPLKDAKYDPTKSGPAPARTTAQARDLGYLINLFKHRALVAVYESGLRLAAASKKKGISASDAFNSCALNLAETARSHCYYFLLVHFADTAATCKDAAVAAVMRRVCALFALSNIVDGHQWHGLIDVSTFNVVEDAVVELLAEIRPDAVPLVDAFEFSDKVLGSTIGRFDGNVYEALYDGATKSKLNFTQPFRGYKEHLQPHLDLALLKTRNGLCPDAKL